MADSKACGTLFTGDSLKFLTDADNAAALAAEVNPEDRADFKLFGHNRLESAFVDRIFIVYECQGRNTKNIQLPPKILTTVRVVGFRGDYTSGFEVKFLDEVTQETMTIGHVPKRLFDYPIFVAIPPRLTVKWDAQFMGDKLVRSLLFAILVKARNKATWFSKGNVYMETPNVLRDLYPHIELDLKLQ